MNFLKIEIILKSIIFLVLGLTSSVIYIHGEAALLSVMIWFTGIPITLGKIIFQLIFRHNKPINKILLSCICLVILIGSASLAFQYEAYLKEKSIHNGNKVVAAIEGFKDKKGSLPKSLDELVPDYINNIPKSAMFFTGSDYEYKLKPNNEYRLTFLVWKNFVSGYYVYDHEKKKWYFND